MKNRKALVKNQNNQILNEFDLKSLKKYQKEGLIVKQPLIEVLT